jgi:L-serine dehydratase
VTTLFASNDINIATMQLYRHEKGGYAVMILEIDQDIPHWILHKIEEMNDIVKATYLQAVAL